jgi:glycosyltransferase involved in cell wall biosynthesis
VIITYDNIIFSLQNSGGISLYWHELMKRISITHKELTLYESKNENLFREVKQKVFKESILSVKYLRYLPFLMRIPSKSIFHSSYYRISLQKDIANITTVHDFVYEKYRKGIARSIHSWQKELAIKKSDGIICVSKSTKNDLLKYYSHIDESKIIVIYNGVGEEYEKTNGTIVYYENKYKILKNKKYLLFVGNRNHYKNFDIAIQIARKLTNYDLVVVGGNIFNDSEINNLRKLHDRVHHFRGVKSVELNFLYNNAFCLLYPSCYEGFGLPIAEAMKSGCPVVSTNNSSIPEVAGRAGLLVSDINAESFILEIRKLENIKFRDQQIQKGLEQSKKFSWDKCFEETYEFYNKTYNRKWK